MKTNSFKFRDFINNINSIKVPSYQRPYSWTRKEILKLITDIETHNENKTNYFIGSIIIQETKNKNYEILDGQQRLTNIFLILKSLSYQENIFDKLILKNNDEIIFRNIMSNTTLTSDFSHMNKNFNFLETHFKEYEVNKIKSLIDYIENLIINVSELDENDDPYNIFESQNSTGVNLDQTDLIRNFLMFKFNNNISLLNRYEREFDSLTPKQLMYFYESYITINSLKLIAKNQLHEEFKKIFYLKLKNNYNVHSILNELLEYKNVYLFITEKEKRNFNSIINTQNIVKLIINQLNIYNTFQVKEPMFLLIEITKDFLNEKLSSEEYYKIIFFINNFLIRRSIGVHNSTGAIGHLFADMYFSINLFIKKNPQYSFSECIINFIYAQKLDSRKIPTDIEIENEFFNKKFYLNQKHKHLKLILESIETYLKKMNNIVKSELDNIIEIDFEREIEHIIPKSLKDVNWKNSIDIEIITEELNGEIGNLTLLKKSNNISASNKHLTDKIKYLKDDLNQMNKLFVNKFEQNPHSFYTKNTIKDRNLEMYQYFITFWELPSRNNTLINSFNDRKYFFDDLIYFGANDLVELFKKQNKLTVFSINDHFFDMTKYQNTFGIDLVKEILEYLFDQVNNSNQALTIYKNTGLEEQANLNKKTNKNSVKKIKTLNGHPNIKISFNKAKHTYFNAICRVMNELNIDLDSSYIIIHVEN